MDRRLFTHPSDERSLDQAHAPFWFLNDRLEKPELERQLQLMRDSGVRCTITHARSGYPGGYMDETWIGAMRTILDDKRAHGEPLWIYDEFNWPSGTCNRTVTLDENRREQYLDIRRMQVKAGERYRYCATGVTISVSAFEGASEEPVDLRQTCPAGWDGVEYVPGQDAEVVEVELRIDPYRGAGGNSVNYLDPVSTDAYLAATHEKYLSLFPEDFGKTIQAFFNDETRLCNALPWSDGFRDTFLARFGYDPVPRLCLLLREGDAAGRFRIDYFDTVAHLFQTCHLKRLHDWCGAHGVKLAAHLLDEETLSGQVRYNGEFMRQLKYMQLPGVDHLGKGIGSLNIKYGSSAARSYGHNGYNCEVFAGCGWELTMDEAMRMTSWLFQQGVQILINHGFFYSTREERMQDWPPSQFFQWSGWDRMPQWNAMIRRLHAIVGDARRECETLVYNPVESFWYHYQADPRFKHGYLTFGPQIRSERAAFIDRELQLLMTGLQDRNLDFDVFHADAIENFEVAGSELVNRLTGERYSTFVLPMADVAPVELLRLLTTFAAQGGMVFAIDCLPRRAARPADDAEVRELVRTMKHTGRVIQLDAGQTAALADTIEAVAPQPVRILEGVSGTVHGKPCYPPEIIDPYLHDGEDLSGVAYVRHLKDGVRFVHFVNYNPEPETIVVRMAGGTPPEVWNTLDGSIAPAEIVRMGEDLFDVRVTLPAGISVFVSTHVAGI